MSIIPQDDQDYLRELFAERMHEQVTLRFFTRPASRLFVPGREECATCEDTRQLLDEVVALSDKLALEVHDIDAERDVAARHNVDRVPTILLEGSNKGVVRYIGAPAGYEFGGLIENVIDISSGTTTLQPESQQVLETLPGPVHIKVFVTPT